MSTDSGYPQRDSFPRGNPPGPQHGGFEESQDNPAVTDGKHPKKRRFGCCLGCGIVGFVMVMVCCGGAAYFGDFVFGTLGEEFGRQVAADASFREHVGEIKEISPNYRVMIQEVQRASDAGEDPPTVYSVRGTKGDAILVVTQDPESSEPAASKAILILPDDTRIPLQIKPGAGNVNDFEEDIEAMEEMEDFIDTGTVETETAEFDTEETTEVDDQEKVEEVSEDESEEETDTETEP